MKDTDYEGFDSFRDKLAELKGREIEIVLDTPSDICEIKGTLVDVGGDFIALTTVGDQRLKMYNARYIISCYLSGDSD